MYVLFSPLDNGRGSALCYNWSAAERGREFGKECKFRALFVMVSAPSFLAINWGKKKPNSVISLLLPDLLPFLLLIFTKALPFHLLRLSSPSR